VICVGDLKLFRIKNEVKELVGTSVAIEKSLQTLIENNMETFFGINFLASEYSTGKNHGGRIDSLGIDENYCPVILEYKRALNENVINQGLFYLDWLMDHKAEFKLLVMEKLGKDVADKIEWSMPRLLCIAGDFTKFDEYAVKQINRNIELIRYKKYEDDLILFELINATTASQTAIVSDDGANKHNVYKTVTENLKQADEELQDMYYSVRDYILNLGDDIQEKVLKYYIAFKKIRNFACVEVYPKSKTILVYLNINPDEVELKEGFTRDVRNIGHYGTGNLEVRINNKDDFEKAKELIAKSYDEN
jgi:predicted transport protein